MDQHAMNPLFWIIAGLAALTWAWCVYRYLVRRTGARLERALSEAEGTFGTLLAATNDAVILTDVASGRIIDCNQRAEELVGMSHRELAGLPRIGIHPPEESARCIKLLQTEKETGSASARNVQVIHRNGYLAAVDFTSRVVSLGNRPVSLTVFRTISGAQDAEETLRDERLFADGVLKSVQALIVAMDREGRIVRFNRMCEVMTGYTVDQVRGRHVWDVLIPARGVASFRQLFSGMVAGDFPSAHENTWLSKQGGERWVAWSYGAIHDSDGRVEKVIATGIDMTARKMAEEGLRRAHEETEKRVVLRTAALRSANDALVQSEARLAEAQRIAHLGSWEWDLASGRLVWSDEVFRILGLSPNEIVPTFEEFLRLVHPDDRVALQAAVDEAIRRHAPYSFDHRVVRPDGTERVVHEQGFVSFDAAGRARRMTGTAQDITERKAAEEALRRAHDELEIRVEARTGELRLANQALNFTQFAMDHAADAVFWTNNDFQFIYVNDTACRFLGYNRRELLALGLSGISSAFDARECRRRLENAPQTSLTLEWLLRRADGSEFPAEITANRLRLDNNDNVCLFARDISERRRAEEGRQAQLQAARTLSAISLRFVAVDDIEFPVREAVKDLMSLLDAECGSLLRVDKEHIALDWRCSAGDDTCSSVDGKERFRPLLPGLRQGEVLVVTSDPPASAVVAVPLLAEQVLVGAIVFDGVRQVDRWREDDFPLLRVAARVITGAIQRHRAEAQTMTLLEENRRLARQSLEIQESERAHLARELHDEMGQCLTAISADAQTVCRLSQGREPRIYESGKAIGEVASRVYEVVRNMMRRLRPEMLDELGLGQALRDVVIQWQARHPEMEWRLSVSEPLGTLPEAVKITAFRMVQESITNVVKHARASQVQVSVARHADGLEILVQDNGLGQNPNAQRGFGLLGMRERVLAARGRFEVSNQPGQGYRVYARFPLAEKEGSEHAI